MTSETKAMERALDLALMGWGRVSPNPLVGAVLLKDGEIVGEGYHGEFGAQHAEAAALEQCADPLGTTCVVNLEPCAHIGKTAACAHALVSAGVARVVFAVSDPHREAAGGASVLRRAGVSVESGVLAREAAVLNGPFLWAEKRPDRPFVAVKLALTVDGFVADDWGASQWITGQEARDHVHWLRAGFEAVAVGRRTAEVDDPQLTARGSVVPRVPPTRVVFGRSGSLPSDLGLVRTASEVPTILLTDTGNGSRAARSLENTAVTVLEADDLVGKLRTLRSSGFQSLLVEGGPGIVGALLDHDLVDRIYLFQAPILLGRGLPGFATSKPTPLEAASPWETVERRALGESNLLVLDREICLPV